MSAVARKRAFPRPAPFVLALLVLWSALGIAVAFGVATTMQWQLAGLAFAALLLLDVALLWRAPTPQVERRLADTWPIGIERPVTLSLETPQRAQTLDVFDLHPGGWSMDGLPRRLRLKRGESASLDYRLCAKARGDFRFGGVQLRLHSPLRLWWQSRVAGEAQDVRVFPNFAPLAKFAIVQC